MATAIWAIVAIVFVSILSALATFTIKKASKNLTFNIKKILTNKLLWIGIIIYGFSMIISLAAYRAGELSVLYPFVAMQYIWATILSVKFLGEKVSILKWAGVLLIVLGVVLVGLGA